MAVRFIFGRAGSGKTHHCLQTAREQLRKDPVNGPALILFIPEQATVQTERMLLSDKDVPGTSRYYTMSFRRLQQMVLEETGFADRELVGPVGRQMILQYLLLRNRRDLQVLAKVADRPGTAASIAASIVELMEEGILAQHLTNLARTIAPAASVSPRTQHSELRTQHSELRTQDSALRTQDSVLNTQDSGLSPAVPRALLSGKLHDLGLIYESYLKWLADGRQADPAALPAETADRLDRCHWLRGAHICLDGFAGFSAQQRYTLARLAQVAGHMDIALLMDPDLLTSNQPPEPYDLFYRTWQTYQQLRQAFLEAHVEVEAPILLRTSPPARFRERPILARIESQLFATTGPVDSTESMAPADSEFELVAAPSRLAEVEAVARKIIDLTRAAPQSKALRYRQIAVLVRDLEPYHDYFQTVLAAHDIPFFIDRRRSVSHHPLVELVRALLRLVTDDWPIDAVATMLKTGLIPVPRDRADLVENYLLAHGIAGWQNWCGQNWRYLRRFVGADEDPAPPSPQEQQTLRKANYARRMLCALLQGWGGVTSGEWRVASNGGEAASGERETAGEERVACHEGNRGACQTEDDSHTPTTMALRQRRTMPPDHTLPPSCAGREWAERLYATLERLKVPQRLMRWQKLATIHGGPAGLEQGQQHKQVWALLTQLLDDLVAGLGDELMNVEQFQATIEAGLEAFSLPLIPPVVDQVVVGSVDRSRQPDITAAFVLGFNEGLFPKRSSQDALLCDQERDLLAQMGGAGSGDWGTGTGERGLGSGDWRTGGGERGTGTGDRGTGSGDRGAGNGGQRPQTVHVELMTSRQRLFDERLLAYIGLTRASRYVWLSYAAADSSGKKLEPSPYLRALKAVLPGLKERTLCDPLTSLDVRDVGTVWQAATGAVLAGKTAGDRGQGTGDRGDNNGPAETATQNVGCAPHTNSPETSTPNAGDWASLGRWMMTDLTLARSVRRVASACDYTNGCAVRPQQAKQLFGEQLRCSVSQLQEYAVCPYRYFAHYGLRLQERPEFELAAVELGSFYHRILYKLAMNVRQRGHSLRTVPHEVLNDLVNRTADEELRAVVQELALTGGREAYLLERAKVDIGSALRGHLGLWKNSSFDPLALEAAFGTKDGWQGLEIRTPKGRCAVLRGKIDRIDAAAIGQTNLLAVIDYKRSSRYKLRLDDAFAGLQVQLIVYMKAAMEAAAKEGRSGAIPGGMYYFNILPTWEKVAPGDLLDPAKGYDLKQWQLKGFTNSDCLPAFREDGQEDGDWPVEIRLKSDGQPYANSPAVNTQDFHRIIDHVWQSLGNTVDRILDGDFAVNPYKAGHEMPCPYCPFDAVCRFAPQFNRYRQIHRSGSIRKGLEAIGHA